MGQQKLRDMTEPELRLFFNRLGTTVKQTLPPDVKAFLVVTVDQENIAQYVSTIDPRDSPKVLRELADRLEKRDTIER